MTSLAHAVVKSLVVLAILLITFEGLSAAAVLLKIVPAHVPSYNLPTFRPFWTVQNPHFGVWHRSNGRYNHISACYNLIYTSNSYGARDREHERDTDVPRVIVLGDSFVEGFGLADHQRLTEVMSAATGTTHINFATSGGFGPVQYLQLYRYLARDFRHDAIIVGLLPDNDFLDNDPQHSARNNDPNYKPMLIETHGGYELTFINPGALGISEKANRRSLHTGFRNIVRNFTFSANAIDYFKALVGRQAPIDQKSYSGFYDATGAQVRRVAFVIKTLVEEAGDVPVFLVLLPRLSDIAAYKTQGPSKLAEAFGTVVPVIDLLPSFAKAPDPSVLFNECDGHWSAAGVRLAAEIIHKAFSGKLYRQ